MEKVIRIGIIGCGLIAPYHIEAIKKTSAEVICCTDINQEIGKEFAKTYNLDYFKDYKRMINQKNLDAIIIATPNYTHYKICSNLIEKGLAIFCEKPMTISQLQARKLKEKVIKNKTFFQLGYMKRFHKAFQKAKKTIKKIEPINSVEIKLQSYKPPSIRYAFPKTWQFSPEKTGGYILPLCGSHLLDMTRFLFGEIKTINSKIKFWPGNRDYSVSALLETSGKKPIFYDIAAVHFKGLGKPKGIWEEKITINGEYGQVILTNPAWKGNEPVEIVTNIRGKLKKESILDNQWQNQMNAFLVGLKNNRVQGATIFDGYEVDKVIADIYKMDKG